MKPVGSMLLLKGRSMAAVPNPKIEPPLPGESLQTLRSAVADFDYEQLLWSSG